MSTILFATIDAGGNVPPALAIACELKSRGHRILFLGHAGQEDRIRRSGFEFAAYSTGGRWNRTERTSSARVVADFVGAATSKRMADDLVRLARAEDVDLTVVDCMLPRMIGAAATLASPSAVIFHTFYAYWNGPWARGPVARMAQLRGVNPRTIWAAADLELVAADAALDPAGVTASPRRIWTGNVEEASVASDPVSPRPKVLVSLSTTWFPGQVETYRRVVAALRGLPVDAIVTTGGMATTAELAPPPNVEVVEFADHAAILPTVSLVVCHGGHSTTMKAVASGVPLLVIPMHPLMDQPMIGKAIARAGLGLTLKKSAKPAAIAEAMTTILADPSFAAAAADAATRVRRASGVAVAADALLLLLTARAPSPVRDPAAG